MSAAASDPTYTRLVQARQAIASPHTDNTARAQATAYVESVKADPRQCHRYGVALFTQNQDHVLRHCGLHLLQHMIVSHWGTFNAQQRVAVRDEISALLANGLQDHATEPKATKEKVVTLFCEVAKRMWPEEWDDMVTQLLALGVSSPSAMELVSMALRTLAEDMTDFAADLTPRKKRDMAKALTDHMDKVFDFLWNVLVYSVQAVRSGDTSNPSPQQLLGFKLLTASLEAYATLCSWIPIHFFKNKDAGSAFCHLLTDPSPICHLASDCINSLVSRRQTVEEAEVSLFVFNELPNIHQALVKFAAAPTDDNNVAMALSVAEFMATVGVNHLKRMTAKGSGKKPSFPPNFQNYLELMGLILNFPNMTVSRISIGFWNKMYALSSAKKLPVAVPEYISASFLTSAIGKIVRPVVVDNAADDEQRAEHASNFSQVRYGMMEVAGCIAEQHPVMALARVRDVLRDAIAFTKTQNQAQDLNSSSYRHIEGAVTLLNAMIRRLPEKAFTTLLDAKALCEEIIRMAFDWAPTDPLLLSCKLNALSHLQYYYQHNAEVLFHVLPRMLALMGHRRVDEAQTPAYALCDATKLARRNAAEAALRLCIKLPKLLAPRLTEVTSFMVKMYTEPEGKYTCGERNSLIDALVCVSSGLRTWDEQSRYLSQLLDPIIAKWKGMMASLTTTDDVIALMGLSGGADANACWRKLTQLDAIAHLWTCLSRREDIPVDGQGFGSVTLGNVTYKSRSALGAIFAQHVLPGMCQFLRLIHALWARPLIDVLAQNFPRVVALPPTIVRTLLGKDTASASSASGAGASGKAYHKFLAEWLAKSRSNCYTFLAGMCSRESSFYSLDGLGNVLLSHVFTGLIHQPNYYLSSCLSIFVSELCSHCPNELIGPVLGPILQPVLRLGLDRLKACWNPNQTALAANLTEIPLGKAPEQREILTSKCLSILTESFYTLLRSTCEVDTSHGKEFPGVAGPNYRPSPLTVSMCSLDQGMSSLVLECLCTRFSSGWSEMRSIGRCLQVLDACLALYGKLGQKWNTAHVLGEHLTKALLWALCRRCNEQHHSQLSTMISAVYTVTSPHGPWVVQQVVAVGQGYGLDQPTVARFVTQELPSASTHKARSTAWRNLLRDLAGADAGSRVKVDVARDGDFMERRRRRKEKAKTKNNRKSKGRGGGGGKGAKKNSGRRRSGKGKKGRNRSTMSMSTDGVSQAFDDDQGIGDMSTFWQ